ncbi:hypothetical protein NUACC21_68120 [Scytonema sp. NUACC21]
MLDVAVNQKIARAVSKEQVFVLPLNKVGIANISLVGGKNASLGEMIHQLRRKGVKVPNGFATTAYAYRFFIQMAGFEAELRQILANLNVEDIKNLRQVGQQARSLILDTPFPAELEVAIAQAYQTLEQQYGLDIDVAVGSSAIVTGLPDASFAGQQETYLNVRGLKALLEACHKCFASIFTDRAITYRAIHGFDHFNVALSVGIQKMVRSDLAVSGVMFSIDTETGFKDTVLITAAYGLGENVVQGAVNPDKYLVFKPTLKQGYRPILNKRIGTKEIKMMYDVGGSKITKNVPIVPSDRTAFALNDDDILQLAYWACLIEEHYSQIHGTYTPMNIDWAKDGITQELFVVQARPITLQEVTLEKVPYTRTKIMMNVENPEEAFGLASIPNDGIGLARMEFIITHNIKAHPLALIHYNELEDKVAKSEIAELTAQYEDKAKFFVDKLAQSIGTIAAAFYPKPVIVRLSDFKSNEYANLLGGKQFEPKEENPMMGWRGASRYYNNGYLEGFALECQAIKQVRDEMGLSNVILMVPFCRTPEEGQRVLAEMAKNGLVRGRSQETSSKEGLEVYLMCELPSNVLLADEFCEVFDGFSIEWNDLTRLTLGLDRGSELVSHLFDERNNAVRRTIQNAIATVKQYGRKIGICGQALSDYPEFVRFLVEQGIDSISLNPDSMLKTLSDVAIWEVNRKVEENNLCSTNN